MKSKPWWKCHKKERQALRKKKWKQQAQKGRKAPKGLQDRDRPHGYHIR